ncbi:hypothetical protein ACHAW5_006618 [Stephanodiscus triporus]|uniref:Aminotransferase class V domain-containing protein n=1 Tax=Stephanodiscus triporus TaxID=2934178 RepID=A0ABD3PJ17_9STRA
MTRSARDMVDFVTTNEMDASRLREGTAMVQNVTSGMNAFVGGHRRASLTGGGGGGGRSVFYYDIAYGSNKKICKHYHGDDAIEAILRGGLPAVISNISTRKEDGDWDDDVAEIYISALDATIRKYVRGGGGNNEGRPVAGSLLILDHITSNTAIRLPISSIAKYAKEEHGMVVVVDGAHALWSLPLDVGALLSPSDSDSDGRRESGGRGHVDAYLTNCHKWFSSPRGAAFVFCADPKVRDTILSRPAVISHGIDDGFLSRFMWDGCRDYSAQLSLPAVLDHWNNAINRDYARMEVRTNLREGIRILCSHWHPGVDFRAWTTTTGAISTEAD